MARIGVEAGIRRGTAQPHPRLIRQRMAPVTADREWDRFATLNVRFPASERSVMHERLQHDQWVAQRLKPTPERLARVLQILDRPTHNRPEPGDELSEGYRSVRETGKYKKAIGKA